ncbi:TonB-dependent receptor domain-containing protein [Hyphomonas adhaerens]|uniref:TonB-dependent receptor domain-containing protein n=1 Tax=Hyphomonas adhaerens TaxID=81029 RepID=UPI00068D35EB|nr:TonB-dependent receptor [Hyphomonas adhaerens]
MIRAGYVREEDLRTSRQQLLGTTAGAILAFGFAHGAAFADENEDGAAERRENTIVITGSYIRGTAEDGLLPVDVFSTEDLEVAGIDSPLEFIKTLPSVGTVLGDSNQFKAGADQGVGSINLRNLGRERTLVLVNGRRTMPTPGDGAADTQLIPMFALERIEILKDGAASTYGSDAIAGVANFVTRKSFDGFEASADYSFVDGSDGDYQVSFLAGKNLDKANFLFGVGYQHRSELPTVERDYTMPAYGANPSGWSALSNPAIYIPLTSGGSPLGIGVDGSLLNACEELGGVDGYFPTSAVSGFPACRYPYVPFDNLVEDEDRYQVYAQTDVDLAADLTLHAEALFASTELNSLAYSPSYPPVQGPNGPGSTSAFYVPRSNPGFETFLDQTFAAGSYPQLLSSGASILLGRPFALGGNPLDPHGASRGFSRNEGIRLSAGLEKEFSDKFRGELYTTWLKSTREAGAPDVIGGRLQAALLGLGGSDCDGTTPGANGCLYFNPFINASPGNPALGLSNPAYVPGLENDPDVINWFSSYSGARGEEEQLIVDLVFSGETSFSLFGGDGLSYAFGAQYRDSDYTNTPLNKYTDPDAVPCAVEGDFTCLDDPNDTNFPTGPFIFLGQYPRENLSQDVYALFGETAMDFGPDVEVTLAARYEDYGGNVGSTFNPKLSARWQITDILALRGSVGTTFRGPLAGDLTESGSTGVAAFNAAGGAYKATQYQGNPNIDPEEALTTNLGILFKTDNFSFSADYWSYDFEGQFVDLPFQAIANAVIAADAPTDGTAAVDCSSPFTQFIVFDGGCVQDTTIASDISRVNTRVVNGPDVKTSGFDLAADYHRDLGETRLSFGLGATYTDEYSVDDFVYEGLTFSTGYDAVGFANYDRSPGTVPKWRGNAFARAEHGNLTANYYLRYVSGVKDNQCPETAACTSTPEFGPTNFGRKVDPYLQHDLAFSYAMDLEDKKVVMRLGIENVLDQEPSSARLPLSYDPYIGNPLGRVYRVSAKVNF